MSEQKLVDYLLGTLPEEEQQQLDEMSLTDDEFVAKLDELEYDLVDDYIRGELPSDASQKFEAHYLASRKRRQKVEFARAFYRSLNRAKIRSWRERLSALITLPRASYQWGFAAAALLMLLVTGWLIVLNGRLQNQADQTVAEYRLLQKQLKDRQPSDGELAEVRQRLRQLEQQLSQKQTGIQLIALNLSPQTRGISRIPSIALPTDADYLALTLQLEPNDFSNYRVTIKDPETLSTVWQSGTMEASQDGGSLIVGIPASILRTQNYVVELSGIVTDSRSETLSSYTFRITSHS